MPDTPLGQSVAGQIVDDGFLGRFAIRRISRTFLKSDMTNGGGTTGFIDFLAAIPPGSIILGWVAETTVGFTGDTTATIQVGVAGAVGDYSADTAQSVFAAGTVAAASIVANSGKRGNALVTPRVTVTGTASFAAIAAGAATKVTVLYLGPA